MIKRASADEMSRTSANNLLYFLKDNPSLKLHLSASSSQNGLRTGWSRKQATASGALGKRMTWQRDRRRTSLSSSLSSGPRPSTVKQSDSSQKSSSSSHPRWTAA